MSNKITLISSDQESFEVEESIISQSQTIKNMIDDDCHTDGIPLLNVTGKTLSKVIEYCKKHAVKEDQEEEEPASAADKVNVKDELKKWDADFVKIEAKGDEKDFVDVFDVILAANYLNIKDLLDLGCQAVADAIKDKTPEQIRRIFNVENDFSPEEEAKVREENQWAFD